MKILVAGGGLFGREHLKTLTTIGSVTLAVAEPREDARNKLSADFALADTDADAFALIDRFQPDGIVIATPADAHAPLALTALEKTIPVLVEKPVTPDAKTLRALCEAAKASRAFLLPGHILRFSAEHRQLHEVLASGRIGKLLQFTSRRYRDASHADRYRDIDPVLMTMIHDIDLALWFSGEPAHVTSVARRPAGTPRSLTAACLETASGVGWRLSTAWLHPGTDCPPDIVEIIGADGSAELTAGSHIEIFGSHRERIPVDTKDDPLRRELECFLDGIRSGVLKPPVTPQDALDGLVVAEAIIGSLRR
ncbi:MAG: Gfo/Idh/MocA family oxidoreductase [Mesorhizobium sp.]|nr:Gfo/Idh/MocA family oxidoreductase [Mesorhizobium sp.]MBL8580296.1 Gfo/Idh/MocA family oxidoreductase [Mesorhizobium sp.]